MNLINQTKSNYKISAANIFILVAILVLVYELAAKYFNLS